MNRHHFHEHEGAPIATEVGDLIVCDIHIYVNCPSREGFKYALNFTDVASKATWPYLCETKDLFTHQLELFYLNVIVPLKINWKRFHSDQDSVIVSKKVREWFASKSIRQTCSPTDTPEMNGIAEAVNKKLGQVTLTFLIQAQMPITFWADAYLFAAYIMLRSPCKTTKGMISPFEFLYGEPPDLRHIRVWGCKTWVIEPRNESRKDWHPKTAVGRYIGLSTLPLGYVIWIPELADITISVNVKFDEHIPSRVVDYFKELEPHLIETTETDLRPVDYAHLVKRTYIDDEDGLLYQITRIIEQKRTRYIVGYVKPVNADGTGKEIRSPIHVADLMRMVIASEKKARLELGISDIPEALITEQFRNLKRGSDESEDREPDDLPELMSHSDEDDDDSLSQTANLNEGRNNILTDQSQLFGQQHHLKPAASGSSVCDSEMDCGTLLQKHESSSEVCSGSTCTKEKRTLHTDLNQKPVPQMRKYKKRRCESVERVQPLRKSKKAIIPEYTGIDAVALLEQGYVLNAPQSREEMLRSPDRAI